MALSGKDGGKFNFSLGQRVLLALLLLLLALASVVCLGHNLDLNLKWQLGLFFGLGLPLALSLSFWVTSPIRHGMRVIDGAARSYSDGDFSLRLPSPKQRELAVITSFYNNLAELAMQERGEIYQKELMLDTLVQCTPMSILLVGAHNRIILANSEAR